MSLAELPVPRSRVAVDAAPEALPALHMLFMHSATVSRWPWRERETGPEPPLKRHWRAPTAWLPVAVLVPWLLLSACQIVQAIKQPEGHGYSDVAGLGDGAREEPLVDRMGQAE